jgi:predicted alpha/beta hydrolase family esterase
MNRPPAILTLPGLHNSTENHWQTLWETQLPNIRRVQQRDWENPVRSEWVAVLDGAIRANDGDVVLVAHSLGCALVAWWAAECGTLPHAAKVRGALIVAPPDVERADFPPQAAGFAPMPRARLPFRATVVASSNDPWCASERARSWAEDWGAEFRDAGPNGHLNAASGLRQWPQGNAWLEEVMPR